MSEPEISDNDRCNSIGRVTQPMASTVLHRFEFLTLRDRPVFSRLVRRTFWRAKKGQGLNLGIGWQFA
jgi:hypothetical protein